MEHTSAIPTPPPGDGPGDADIHALAQRVAVARGKIPLQSDPALFEELSESEIVAERKLAEWARAQRREQRKRALAAELASERRDRKVAMELDRADDADARWHRRALAARRRVDSADARLAQLYRRAEWSSRALIGVVVLGMVWAGVNVQHNLVPSGDMHDPLYWLSYGFEAMISIPIITIMVVATTAARWGREIDRGKVVFLEAALLGVTIALNAGPHLARGATAHAAEAGVAPVMVGVVIWLHAWVSARYAQLIEGLPVTEPSEDVRRRESSRVAPADYRAEAPALPAASPEIPVYAGRPVYGPERLGAAAPTALATAVPFTRLDAATPRHSEPARPPVNGHAVTHRHNGFHGTDGAESEGHIVASATTSEPAAAPAGSDVAAPATESGIAGPVVSAPAPSTDTATTSVTSIRSDDAAASVTPIDAAAAAATAPVEPAASVAPLDSRRADPTTAAPTALDDTMIAELIRMVTTRTDDAAEPAHEKARPEPELDPEATEPSDPAEPIRRPARRATVDTAQYVLDTVAAPVAPAPRRTPVRPLTVVPAQDTPHARPAARAPEAQQPREPQRAPAPQPLPIPADTLVHNGDAEIEGVEVWAVAREISERGLSGLPVDQLAEILTLADQSWTPAGIGAEVGMSGSAVLRILEAARRLRPHAISG
ncbi:hypothetical protein [Nocardia stercoris]|nr:hypothetical protein [Nocardia stercoris]